jgi:hypothetical protein
MRRGVHGVSVGRAADQVDTGSLRAQLVQRQAAQQAAPKLDTSTTVRSATATSPRSDPFEDRGEALSAADAHGFQPVARAAPVKFAGQRGQHPAAGRADRMTQ